MTTATPDGRAGGNGMTAFSLHAYSDASSSALEGLRAERQSTRSLGREVAGPDDAVDPETAAQRYLQQALAGQSIPSLNAPVTADGATSEFRTINTETVPLTGTRVVKFRQTVNGIPVYGSLVVVELDESNDLVALDTSLGEPTGVDPVASISPAQALLAAQSAPGGYSCDLTGAVPRISYYFDSSSSGWRLVYILEDVPVTLDTGAELDSNTESNLEPPRFVDFVVDAHDGSVVSILPRTPSVTGLVQSAIDAFGVLRKFFGLQNGEHIELFDPEHNVKTYDFGFGNPEIERSRLPGSAIMNPPDWTSGAVSAHANAVAVSDYLRTVLHRDNIDNRGSAMVSTINCVVPSRRVGAKEWHNAFWDGSQMVYGQAMHGTELRTLAANIDVVAHEMFHGITDHTSRLEYALQPGALNESYSDIFGTIIANLGNSDPRTWDWKLGENLLGDDRPFRDLSNPPAYDQPDHMDDFQRLPNNQGGDWGGVHINSGIHNKAAYNLLTAEHDAHALALQPDEVAAILYLALTQRLSRTSQFADSRRAVVASARSLFRALPPDEQQSKVSAIEGAFDAVGIR